MDSRIIDNKNRAAKHHEEAQNLVAAKGEIYSPNSGDSATETFALKGDESGWYREIKVKAGKGYTTPGQTLAKIQNYNGDCVVEVAGQRLELGLHELCNLVAAFQAWELVDSKFRPDHVGLRGVQKVRKLKMSKITRVK
jgi:hypothetical protein